MHNKNSSYRPDIDGLRALAVLAVVAFHFNKEWISGGFAGVDIFFVISGFLITGIIHRQVVKGQFSFSDFYLRRVRRILPAAFFLLIGTLIAGSAWLLPEDFEALSKSAIASALSAANIYFWMFLDTSYFAASSDTVPLLHLWSLGVEEQFYLLWPALMILAYRLGGKRLVIGAAVLLAAASFVTSQYSISKDPSFAYYMLPSRGGELLIGALAFFASDSFKKHIPWVVRELIAAAGIAAIVWSLLYLNENEGFPGYISLVPSLGAALLIFAGCYGPSLSRAVFSFPPFVWVGLISFSLYLWHWPVLAFYRYAYGPLTLEGSIGCAAIMLALTLFAYFFVEKPFRQARKGPVQLSAIGLVGTAIVAVSAVSIANSGMLQTFYPSNYAERLKAFEGQTSPSISFPYVCQASGGKINALFTDPRCLIGPKDKAPHILMVGDSNSSHFVGYFKEMGEHYGISLRNISHPICPPFKGDSSIPYSGGSEALSCMNFNQIFREQAQKYDTLVISGFWTYYAEKSPTFLSDLTSLFEEFKNKKIIIGLTVPMFAGFDMKCYAKSIKIPSMGCEQRDTSPYHEDYPINNEIEKIAKNYPNISTFSLHNVICKDDSCSAYTSKKPIYWDGYHLSGQGSELLGKEALRNQNIPDALKALFTEIPHVENLVTAP
jgi:peptidoglycan/LPS O-acetylase OafA/YrhL